LHSRPAQSFTITRRPAALVVPGHPPDLDLGPRGRRDPLGPLDRLLLRGDVEQEEAPEQFLGLAVRPVRDHRGLAAEVDHDALARIVQPFRHEENAGLDHLLDELAGRGHHLVDVGHQGRVRLVDARMISRYFGIAFSSSVGPPLGPRTLTSNEWPADRHGPGEISRRDAADPSDPRCARQSKSLSDG
jgi:hypothetical protein